MWTYNTLVVLVGASLLGAFCGVVGCFAVLRRRALLGDAMAHAALPGVALAFWITQSKSVPVLLAGALGTGLFGIWAMAVLRRRTRTKEDAALGLVLSVLFGAGVALSRYVSNVVPDGSKAGLDTFVLGKTAGIVLADVILIGIVALVSIALVAIFFKEFRALSFDHDYAQSLGWNTTALDFLLMSMVSLAVVAGLPMVGVVMVAALTILPAVSARMWTHRLSTMLLIAAAVGVVGAAAGVMISAERPQMPTGPVVILCMGVLFLASALFAPANGVAAQAIRRMAFQAERGARLAISALATGGGLRESGVIRPALALAHARRSGWIERGDAGWQVTEAGRREIQGGTSP